MSDQEAEIAALRAELEQARRERDEAKRRQENAEAECNAVVAALKWKGDGYEWSPQVGDYREEPIASVYRHARQVTDELSALRAELAAVKVALKAEKQLRMRYKLAREADTGLLQAENARLREALEEIRQLAFLPPPPLPGDEDLAKYAGEVLRFGMKIHGIATDSIYPPDAVKE